MTGAHPPLLQASATKFSWRFLPKHLVSHPARLIAATPGSFWTRGLSINAAAAPTGSRRSSGPRLPPTVPRLIGLAHLKAKKPRLFSERPRSAWRQKTLQLAGVGPAGWAPSNHSLQHRDSSFARPFRGLGARIGRWHRFSVWKLRCKAGQGSMG